MFQVLWASKAGVHVSILPRRRRATRDVMYLRECAHSAFCICAYPNCSRIALHLDMCPYQAIQQYRYPCASFLPVVLLPFVVAFDASSLGFPS